MVWKNLWRGVEATAYAWDVFQNLAHCEQFPDSNRLSCANLLRKNRLLCRKKNTHIPLRAHTFSTAAEWEKFEDSLLNYFLKDVKITTDVRSA